MNNKYNYMNTIEEHRINRINNNKVKQFNIFKNLMVIAIFITILFITIFSIRAFVYANDNRNCNNSKQFKSICIYCGDSIDTISNSYLEYGYDSDKQFKKEIISINHLSNNEILIPGNYIVVPYYVSN